jgi:hypothetical protein
MNFQQLLLELSQRDVKLSLDGEQLDIDAPETVLTDELITALKQHKQELVQRLQQSVSRSIPLTAAVPRQTVLPLSLGQERLWQLIELGSNSAVYNITLAYQVSGPFETEALSESLSRLSERHEILRTSFQVKPSAVEKNGAPPKENGEPVQVIAESVSIPLVLTDKQNLPCEKWDAFIQSQVTAEAAQAFDLGKAPLFRVRLLQLAPEETVLIFVVHHIIADLWSLNIIFRELRHFYKSIVEGEQSTLPDLAIQYADYVMWQRHPQVQAKMHEQLTYWKTHLKKEVKPLLLPYRLSATISQSYAGSCQLFQLSREQTEMLRKLSQETGVTLFTTLLSGLSLLFHCYTQQEEFLIASPMSGRTQPQLEGIVGYFNNVLPLQVDLSGDPQLNEVLQRMSSVVIGANRHQDVPLQEVMQLPGIRRAGIMRAAFALQTAIERPLEQERLIVKQVNVHSGMSNFDYYLQMWEDQGQLVGVLEYRKDLFADDTIKQMIQDLQRVWDQLVMDPRLPLNSLSIATNITPIEDLTPREKSVGSRPPENEIQERLLRIFEDVLQIQPIGITDNFFELGGNSLVAAQLIIKTEEVSGYR